MALRMRCNNVADARACEQKGRVRGAPATRDQRSKVARLTLAGRTAKALRAVCGSNSAVECHLAKVDVVGSNPISRSNKLEQIQPVSVDSLAGFFVPSSASRIVEPDGCGVAFKVKRAEPFH